MMPPEHTPKPGTREHFLQVSQLQRWGTIQEYVDLCRTQGYFTPAFYALPWPIWSASTCGACCASHRRPAGQPLPTSCGRR
jgi:hypothetical protein